MKLPKEATNELAKYGFYWIALKVIFQDPKGPKKIGCFATFRQFSQKRSDDFLRLCIHLFADDRDQLTVKRWIWFNYSESHFQGRKGHYSVITKCCPNLLHHVSSLVWNQSYPKIWRCEITLNVVFNIRTLQFGPLWSIWANISETVHAMINVSMKHSYKIIYNQSINFFFYFTTYTDSYQRYTCNN